MRRAIFAAGLLAAGASALVVGCSEIPVNDSPNGPTCKAVAFLASFFNSTVNCTTTAATTTATSSADVTISGNGTNLRLGASVDTGVAVSISLHRAGGTLQTGSWTSSTAGMTGTITITHGANSYLTTANTGANQGTFTLTITKSSVLTTTANGTAYLIDGTLDATVPAVTSTGASGTATLHIDFTNN